jgi:predicted DsbA family dithiol-disulfide isomerase
LERLSESHGVDVNWRSFELRPAGSPPMSPEYRAKIEANRPRLNAIASEQYELELNQGPFGINSRPALVGAKWAEAQGHGPAYHRAVMQAYWQAGQDISDMEVLAAIATSVGLDGKAFRAALDDTAWHEAVDTDIRMAQAYGLNSVPAIVLAEKYLVSGAQPYEALVEVVEKIQAEENEA